MIKKTLLAFFFLIFLSSQSQNNQNDIIKRNREVHSLNQEIKKATKTIAVLENRLSQSSNIIENQNSIISGFGVIYTILTIVFTIIGLLVPVVTYYFGIKPSREQIKNLESNFDNRLEEYLKLSKETEINIAIEKLSDDSPELKQNAIAYLSLTQHQGFSDLQYFKLYKIINSELIDTTHKQSLASVLTGKENQFATEYCKNILLSKNQSIEYISARYFGMIGVINYIQIFKNYIETAQQKEEAFIRIISHMKVISLNSVIDFLNSKDIISIFNNKEKKILKKSYFFSNFEKGNEENKLKETELYKIIFNQ